jgi:hypothetical protein
MGGMPGRWQIGFFCGSIIIRRVVNMSRPDDFISKESRFSKILGIATRVLLSLMVLSLLITSAALATTIPITATGAGLTVAGTPDPNWLIENDTAYPGLNGQPAQLLAPGCNN